MAFAYCPECGGRVYVGRKPWLGQPVGCEQCEADLEVVEVHPLTLDWEEGELADDDWVTDRSVEMATP